MEVFKFSQVDGEAVKKFGTPYRKTSTTWLKRVDGPFAVETAEGPLTCEDGYLAYDEKSGHVWPVATEYVDMNYEKVE